MNCLVDMVSPSVIIMVPLVVIKAKSRSNFIRKKQSTFTEHLLALCWALIHYVVNL